MALSRVSINFYVDGGLFAFRAWDVVPRVGDEVMLGPKVDGRTRQAYRVTRVVWGVEGPEEEAMHRQAVNIVIEKVVE